MNGTLVGKLRDPSIGEEEEDLLKEWESGTFPRGEIPQDDNGMMI